MLSSIEYITFIFNKSLENKTNDLSIVEIMIE